MKKSVDPVFLDKAPFLGEFIGGIGIVFQFKKLENHISGDLKRWKTVTEKKYF